MKGAALTVFAYFFLGSVGVFGQCIPDPQYASAGPGIWPDSLTNLPVANAGASAGYSSDINIKTLTDTNVVGAGTVYVHAMRINPADVTGLPVGFSFAPDYTGTTGWQNTGTAPNMSPVQGCVNISASQSAVQAALTGGPNNDGVFPLTVKVDMQVTVPGLFINTPTWLSTLSAVLGPLPANDDYILRMQASMGSWQVSSGMFSIGPVYPNPLTSLSGITINSASYETVHLEIIDVTGKVIKSSEHAGVSGRLILPIDATGVRAGVYFCSVSQGNYTVNRKLIILE